MKNYYNLEVKQRYIKYISEKMNASKEGNLFHIFNLSTALENEKGKDISSFNKEEILSFYKSLKYKMLSSLKNVQYWLNSYSSWMQEQGYIKENFFKQIDYNMLCECINYDGIQKELIDDSMMDDWNERIVNSFVKFAIRAIYEGMYGDYYNEIVLLKLSDIDEERKEANLCTHRVIKVSDKLIELAKQSYNVNAMIDTIGRERKFDQSDYIVKYRSYCGNIPDPEKRGRNLYAAIRHELTVLGEDWCTVKSIRDSGMVNWVLENSRELCITPHEYIYGSHIRKLESQYNMSIPRAKFYTEHKEVFE